MAGKREGRSGRRGQETSPGSSIGPGDSGQRPGGQLSPVGAPSHGQVLAALGLGYSSSQGRVRMCSPFTGPSWKRDLRGCAAGLDPPLWVLPHFCARCVLCTDQDRALGSRRCCPTFPGINSFLPRLPHPCEHTRVPCDTLQATLAESLSHSLGRSCSAPWNPPLLFFPFFPLPFRSVAPFPVARAGRASPADNSAPALRPPHLTARLSPRHSELPGKLPKCTERRTGLISPGLGLRSATDRRAQGRGSDALSICTLSSTEFEKCKLKLRASGGRREQPQCRSASIPTQ